MDFVDLDKVLDEFEEEEKQALSIIPGQELRPSGYLEFLEKHQEQEWALINPGRFSSTSGYTLERRSAREPANVSYDDPYDSLPTYKFGCVTGEQLSSVPYKRHSSLPEGKQRRNQSAIVTSLTRISVHDEDVSTVYTTPTKAQERKGIANCSERKGTIAYHPIEVQTDALSPASEKELMLSPFPKSDILVDGHEDASVLGEHVCHREIEENQSSAESSTGKPDGEITQSARVSTHTEDDSQRLQPATRDVDRVPNSTSLFDPRTPVVSAGETGTEHPQSEPIVCFNDLADEDFDNEEINMYLNQLQGQRITNINTSEISAPVRSVHLESATTGESYGGFRDENRSHDTGNSISHEEFNARNISQAEPGNRSVSVLESSYRNTSQIHANNSDNMYIEPNNGRSSDVNCDVQNISDIEPSSHRDVASQSLYDSLIIGKMEIETILDDINNTEPVNNNIRGSLALERMENENLNVETTSCVSEQVLCGRMEIENILDEVILKQQGMLEHDFSGGQISQRLDSNCSHLQSNTDHGSDNIEDRAYEAALVASDSDSSSPVRSFGQNYQMGSSVQIIGVGARPKDLSSLKKNRLSASSGLSKSSSEMPADAKPKGTTEMDDNTFHKQIVEQFPDSSVQFHQSADDECPNNTLLEDHQNLELAESRSDSSNAVEPEEKPVLHDFSEPQSSDRQDNDESAETDGHDDSQTAGAPNMKRPTSLDLPSQAEGAAEGNEEDVGHTASVDTTEQTNQGTAETKSVIHATDLQDNLGLVAPFWIPDTDALTCMICQTKFTIWKRRHHCRACGKVLCAVCCNQKAVLPYMDNKEARVCVECHIQLNLVPGSGTSPCYPNPNNPFEYCSKVPPSQQVSSHANPPVVMVPAGVLRSSGGQKRFGEPKQVMFSDGVRPGGDLAKLDEPQQAGRSSETSKAAKPSHHQQASSQAQKLKSDGLSRNQSLIPGEGLPPLHVPKDTDSMEADTPVNETDAVDFKSEEGPLVMFTLNRNLSVGVKIINLGCCLNRTCWCFVTLGMDTVGESEIVVLLELTEEELASPSPRPPRDMFLHLQALYEEALKGDVIKDMGHFIFHRSNTGNTESSGFFFLRPTFQCLNKIPLPESPYMFGILIQKYELPWARVFPLRLMLRLGAEFKYYPCPLISMRDRKPVFFEIGHTIINLLADFRSYQYMLPQIKGVTIHMENKKTVISLPRNQYNDIMKAVRNSNEHVMALGSSFSTEADSHLVCIQSEDGNYQTQAINIQDKPRLVTGASFVVFNGALKMSSGLRAKSSIVEDGLMVQVLPDALASIKEAIKNTTDYTVQCGLLDAATSEEVVELRWVDHDRNFNVGVKSYIDGTSLETADMITIKPPVDYTGETLAIRWTRVYFLQGQNSTRHSDSVNMNQLMEDIAHACCSALIKHLDELNEEGCVKLGLRVNLTRDSIGYEIGSKGQSLPVALLNTLDTFLIPVIHLALLEGILMEFIFNIVE